jgi:hypothetical protein
MISRRSSTRFAASAAAALLLAGGAGFAISACSSSSTDAGPAAATEAGTDAGTDARTKVDAATPDTDSAVPETSAQCLARCGTEHPASVAKYNAVDTCWAASCNASCVAQNGMFDAGGIDGGFDAGGVNDGGTDLCGTMVSSGVDMACDDCTTAFCCPAWKGCYDDQDCLAYNTCVNDCP